MCPYSKKWVFRNAVAPSPAAQTIKKLITGNCKRSRAKPSGDILQVWSLCEKRKKKACFSNATWQWLPSLTPTADRLAVWVEEGAGWMGAQGSIERSGGKDGGRCTQRKRQKRQRQKDFCIFACLASLRSVSSDGCNDTEASYHEANYHLLLGFFLVNICRLYIKLKVQSVWQSVDPLPWSITI